MGVYIKGMEMPSEGEYHMTLYVCSDGSAYIDVASFPVDEDRFKAVPVPEHGRLIEESKVLDIVSEWCPDDDGSVGKDGDLREMLDEIEALPTIIPADKEVDNGRN